MWRKVWKGIVARNLQARQKTGKAGSKESRKLLLGKSRQVMGSGSIEHVDMGKAAFWNRNRREGGET